MGLIRLKIYRRLRNSIHAKSAHLFIRQDAEGCLQYLINRLFSCKYTLLIDLIPNNWQVVMSFTYFTRSFFSAKIYDWPDASFLRQQANKRKTQLTLSENLCCLRLGFISTYVKKKQRRRGSHERVPRK